MKKLIVGMIPILSSIGEAIWGNNESEKGRLSGGQKRRLTVGAVVKAGLWVASLLLAR